MDDLIKQRLWTRDFILLFMVGLMTAVGMQILNATMSLYVDYLGGTTIFSGLIATGFAVSAGIVRLISGRFSDLRGRRLTMIIGACIFAPAILFFGIFALLPALLFFRTVQGIGFSAISTASAAAVVDVTPKARIGEGIGYYGLGISLAMAVGPAIGIPFAMAGKFTVLYIITAGMIAASLVFSLFCNYEKRLKLLEQQPARIAEAAAAKPIDNTAYKGLWKFIERRALPASLTYFLACIAFASMITFMPLFAKAKGYNNVALFFILQAVAMFVARFFAGRVYDRKGPLFVIIPSLFGSALAFVLIAASSNETMFLAIALLYGLTMGMALPAFNALAVRHSPAHRRGAASATFYLCIDAGIGLGSSIWGLVIDQFGFIWMFAGAALCVVLALVISIFAYLFDRIKSVQSRA
jgi:MFS family permease